MIESFKPKTKVMKNGSTKERSSAEEKPMCSCPAQSCCVLAWSYFLSYGESSFPGEVILIN